MEFVHESVLLKETIDNLKVKPNGIYVDGTLGGGGHSFEILSRLDTTGRLIGIDQDEDAIKASGERLCKFGENCILVRSNYSMIDQILDDLKIEYVDGIVLDLGVSSYQLDDPERGFTYKTDAPLDMRMDQRRENTAETIVNEYGEKDLERILREYGEEKFSGRIARNIVAERSKKRIKTTGELVDIIRASIPMKFQVNGGHPAKRTFQAIRIELNEELSVLESSIDKMIDRMDKGGRLCIITFHSLEDRIVKNAFKRNENPCTCPPDLPVCVCGKKSKGTVITRKPVVPEADEIVRNKRAKSAKLRVFERIITDRENLNGTNSSKKGKFTNGQK